MKLRVLKKKVYVSPSALPKKDLGWGFRTDANSISREKDILQQWDDKEGWVDVPVHVDSLDVYGDGKIEVRDY